MIGNASSPKRGEVWFVDLGRLDPSKGAEIQKSRPVLIISNNVVNQHRRTILGIPLATGGGKATAHPPITVQVHCGGKTGVAVIDQLRAIDKHRLINLVDVINPTDFQSVIIALKQILEIF